MYQSRLSFPFINSIIDVFNQEKEDLLKPTNLFEERKELSFQIPFCKRNENKISHINDKLEVLTNCKVKFDIFKKKKQTLFIRVLAYVVSFM